MNERYPTKLVVENIAGKAKLRKTAKASNLSSISQSTSSGLVTTQYGIDLAVWITWAIAEGLIATGDVGDTHMMSTNLTSTANRAHTIGEGFFWSVTGGAGDEVGIIIATNDSVEIGDVVAKEHGTIVVGPSANGVKIFAMDGSKIELGDVDGDFNSTVFEIDDDNADIRASTGSFFVDSNHVYLYGEQDFWLHNIATPILIGDAEGVGNGTRIAVDDPNSSITLTGAVIFTPILAATASALTPAEGMMLVVSDTDATFTSTGAWIYQGAAWHKITVV